jgi:hypothetical protein
MLTYDPRPRRQTGFIASAQEDHVTYQPSPRPTAHVQLSGDLLGLLEDLARNAHDVWAKQRLDDGWSYGPRRDDQNKKHPCLVPYEQLPETEKEYDRRMAAETLKTIVVLGYRIEKA